MQIISKIMQIPFQSKFCISVSKLKIIGNCSELDSILSILQKYCVYKFIFLNIYNQINKCSQYNNREHRSKNIYHNLVIFCGKSQLHSNLVYILAHYSVHLHLTSKLTFTNGIYFFL